MAPKVDLKGKGRLGSPLLSGGSASGAGGGVPTEYKLTLQNTDSKNMFIFGEKEEEVVDSGEVGARKRRRMLLPFHLYSPSSDSTLYTCRNNTNVRNNSS